VFDSADRETPGLRVLKKIRSSSSEASAKEHTLTIRDGGRDAERCGEEGMGRGGEADRLSVEKRLEPNGFGLEIAQGVRKARGGTRIDGNAAMGECG